MAKITSVATPCAGKTLKPAMVKAELAKVKNQFVTIEFYKKDGTLRKINGQLRATSRLVGSERGAVQGAAMKDRGQVWIAKPDKTSGSFFDDRVRSIHYAGVKLEVNE